MTATRELRIKTPGDLIASVPAVLGFHPEESMVMLTVGAAVDPVFARVDLPTTPADVAPVADQLVDVACRHAVAGVALVAFTDDDFVAELVLAAIEMGLRGSGVEVAVAVRADGSRWYRLGGPPDEHGTPYDLDSHPFTLQAVVDGRVVHENRAALQDSLLPVDPDEVQAVAEAMGRAADRFAGAVDTVDHVVSEARWLQARVRRFLQDGERLPTEDVARALVAMVSVQVRDVAWAEITRFTARRNVDLWRDVVRRGPLEALAPAAGLLAFAGWLAGDGALAWCALDRCREVDPDYSMAQLVARALTGAVPPSTWQPLDPEDLPLFRR